MTSLIYKRQIPRFTTQINAFGFVSWGSLGTFINERPGFLNSPARISLPNPSDVSSTAIYSQYKPKLADLGGGNDDAENLVLTGFTCNVGINFTNFDAKDPTLTVSNEATIDVYYLVDVDVSTKAGLGDYHGSWYYKIGSTYTHDSFDNGTIQDITFGTSSTLPAGAYSATSWNDVRPSVINLFESWGIGIVASAGPIHRADLNISYVKPSFYFTSLKDNDLLT